MDTRRDDVTSTLVTPLVDLESRRLVQSHWLASNSASTTPESHMSLRRCRPSRIARHQPTPVRSQRYCRYVHLQPRPGDYSRAKYAKSISLLLERAAWGPARKVLQTPTCVSPGITAWEWWTIRWFLAPSLGDERDCGCNRPAGR